MFTKIHLASLVFVVLASTASSVLAESTPVRPSLPLMRFDPAEYDISRMSEEERLAYDAQRQQLQLVKQQRLLSPFREGQTAVESNRDLLSYLFAEEAP